MDGEARIAVVVMRNLSRLLAAYARRNPVVVTEPAPRPESDEPTVKPSWVLTIAGVAALVWLARGLALPVFLALIFAYLLSPMVARADTLAVRRSVAVGALFAVIIAVLLGAGLLLGPRMLTEAVGAGGPPAGAGESDRHRPRRRGAGARRDGAGVPPCAPRGRGLGPPVRPRPSSRGPERILRARRAPFPARDPRPVLRLLLPPGHAADRHRGHEPAASPARGDVRRGLARAQRCHRPLHPGRGAGRSGGGGAGGAGALGTARALSPPARRFRRHRQRGAVRRAAALGRRRRLWWCC